MKRIIILLFIMFTVLIQAESIDEIIDKIDKNMTPESMIYKAEMVIYKKNKKYTKKMTAYISDGDAFVEFEYPKRDKGTKYLKKDDNLWIYFPKVERPQKLSGHMLRQSMMGSDFSYEDSTQKNSYKENYTAKLIDENEEEYIMELIGRKGKELTYDKQKIWVDKNKYVIKKSEFYAKSGKLLKDSISQVISKVGNRYYPTKIKMDDKLRSKTYTIFEIKEIELNTEIDPDIFSIKKLERR